MPPSRKRMPWLLPMPTGDIDAMLAAIDDDVRATAHHTGRHALSDRVRTALREVRRDAFVPELERDLAYLNHPLSIGYGQTISQPFIVAIMTELLELAPDHTVLEIGTGSGYQAAVLARLARAVYSIEIVPELAVQARETLVRLGCDNVQVRAGDGTEGWPEHAPFDAIMITAAAPSVAPALLAQLKPGGRLVAPLDAGDGSQILTVIHKEGDRAVYRSQFPVRFVPVTHGHKPQHRAT